MFLYSKQNIVTLENIPNNTSNKENFRVVNQVDLSPTLSLLLNHSIPFGSLGMIIPELFNTNSDEIISKCQLLKHQTSYFSCDELISIDFLTNSYFINSIQVKLLLFFFLFIF